MAFLDLAPPWTPARPRHATTPDFARLLGRAWNDLPTAVQARFGTASHHRVVVYSGEMVVRANPVGWLFAQVCRLIGTPLAPWRGADVPVRVDVHLDQRGGLAWDRTYDFAGHRPVMVSSAKLMSPSGALMEVVRGGLGMTLAVTVEDRALHFRSLAYFATLGPIRLPLPLLTSPGRAHVIHTDMGGGTFRFTLIFTHPLFGETLFQDGLFRDPPEGVL
ncbi:hypothetical protein QO010_002544 [Caulobacter ginsengisoli]|uniref:DUF4166 domain-containing protein n=1 Tax=Caulobacter ginsengisoli TaxID=400775 RepID=A0ABU0ITK8_9CAUL|nr:DUF4166 domain-containing protein [Caulobacter ginsengisoli]MDQ0464760.1 hypothetical protein [Caulobacter ginsengisoli]